MLSKLVPDIQKTAELVQEISASSNDQDKGMDQINKAIQQLNEVVQENASAAEQISATAEELSSQAIELQDTIDQFKIDLSGNSAAKKAKAFEKHANKENPHMKSMQLYHPKDNHPHEKHNTTKGVDLDMTQE